MLERDAFDQQALALGAVGLPLLPGRRVGQHESRRHAVDRDAERAELVAELARQADQARLGRGIGLDAGLADAEARAARDVDDAPAPRGLHAESERA